MDCIMLRKVIYNLNIKGSLLQLNQLNFLDIIIVLLRKLLRLPVIILF